MKNQRLTIGALVACCSLLLTREAAAQKAAEGYFVAAYGADSVTRSTGNASGRSGRLRGLAGGGGVRLGGKLGIGAELGFLGHSDDELPLGYLSVGVSRHLRTSQARRALVPFVAGGYTKTLYEAGSGFYVGAGVNYWGSTGKALRVEFRKVVSSGKDYAASNSFNHVRDAWLVRVGMSFGRPK